MATELAFDRDRIQKFFDDLEARRTIVSSCTQLFTALTTQFTSLQDSISQRSQSLDSKFQSLESDSQQRLESLTQRETSIPERESVATAKVEELKQNALRELENPSAFGNLSDSLKWFSRRMDSSGLLKYVTYKRKDAVSLRAELPNAISEAVDHVTLILDAVDVFVSNKVDKPGVTDQRRACGMLLQALFPDDSYLCGKDKGPEFARSVVESAGEILEKWKDPVRGEEGKGRGRGRDGGGVVGPAEAIMFLQMVAGFRLKPRFDEDFLRMLVIEHASRRDMAQLAIAVGFGEKMGEIVDELMRNGKEIEAVYFVCESGLTERFPPVSLIKSYRKNTKKNFTTLLKNGNHSAAATEESNTLELTSIRAIIKCVEDNKLESEFPLDGLRKRATQLQNVKTVKKKSSAVAAKPQSKRSHGSSSFRGSGSSAFRPSKTAKFSNSYSPFSHRNAAPPVQHNPAARYSGPYNYPSQSAYEGHATNPYASTYGVSHAQSPAVIAQQHYSLPVDNMGAAGFHTNASYGPQTSYGAYDHGSGVPPA